MQITCDAAGDKLTARAMSATPAISVHRIMFRRFISVCLFLSGLAETRFQAARRWGVNLWRISKGCSSSLTMASAACPIGAALVDRDPLRQAGVQRMALRRKRKAAGLSRLAVNRKSMVWPSRSTARL
jgi:hypothetical protein